jgi:uncharacterized RDD family membrane protein YckC
VDARTAAPAPHGRHGRHARPVDPTQALWRRIGAYLVDGLVGALLAAGVVVGFADVDTIDAADCPDDLPGGRVCLDAATDDTVTLVDAGPVVAALALTLGWVVLNDVLLQGATGATVGKFITGARTVRPDGRPPGIGRALVRTLLLIVDGISLILPLGLWVALFSRGHQRLGDMVAGTYVVKARYAGTPVELP